jgi:choline kinase
VTPAVRRAVILAAGMGTRLRSAVGDRPKGLIEIEGETLVGRSLRLLRAAGVERMTVVVGFQADQYRRFAANASDIDLVVNEAFETTGSMASLARALDSIDEDLLLLESDIVYQARALDALLDQPQRDATLLSGPTAAGDEVWVYAPAGLVRAMSKQLDDLPGAMGEFVGLTRLSRAACAAMREAFSAFVRRNGHARMNYETDALVEIASRQPIAAILVADLVWGEIDDDRQFTRVVQRVWPALKT